MKICAIAVAMTAQAAKTKTNKRKSTILHLHRKSEYMLILTESSEIQTQVIDSGISNTERNRNESELYRSTDTLVVGHVLHEECERNAS